MAQETSAAATRTSTSNDDLHRQLATLREDIQALRTDFKELAVTAGERGKSRLGDAKDRLAESARHLQAQVSEKAQAAYTTTRDATTETAEKARVEINKRPLTVVAAAFLGGVLIGGIFLGRMVRRR